jgi:acetyl-CoA carboxylase carboxyl transferase subunit beta
MALFRKPRYSTVKVRRRDIPEGLWEKCKGCGSIIYNRELEEACRTCPKCGFHFPMSARQRIDMLCEAGTFEERDAALESVDALHFTGVSSYPDKLRQHKKKTGLHDAILTGTGRVGDRAFALGVMDFSFLGASMGSVVGERVARITEHATENRLPLVLICASGGARMYEGVLSLMQLAKTSGALERHRRKGLPYLSVLTNPTYAGVMASYASLGDLILAEPGALIGFAGPRVIRETTQQELPEGFQTAEFLLEHGLIDMIVPRKELRKRLLGLLDIMFPARG